MRLFHSYLKFTYRQQKKYSVLHKHLFFFIMACMKMSLCYFDTQQ